MLAEDVVTDIRFRVEQGFDSRESTFEWILGNHPRDLGITEEEYGAEDLDPAMASTLRDAIEHAFAEREREMATWPELTDCDRLRAAFAALDEQGIVALESPGLTQDDSIPVAADLAVVREEVRARAGHAYCFFTWNDMARAIDGDGLSLAYGTFEDDEAPEAPPAPPPPCPLCKGRGWIAPSDPSAFPTPCSCRDRPPAAPVEAPAPGLGEKVGAAVLQACRDAGLNAEWDGQGTSFVEIPDFRWQRRLVRSEASDVRDFLESWDLEIRAGYTAASTILDTLEERACDWFERFSDFGPALRSRLRMHTEGLLEEERRREASWSEATTNDRIAGAFGDLRDRGIFASENLGLTIQDGWGYAGVQAPPDCRGVVFFHHEDVIDGVSGRGLVLAFGAVHVEPTEDDAASAALAREIVSALGEHGIPATWSGALSDRIRIAPFEWRRRRWTETPPYERRDPPPTTATGDGKRDDRRVVAAPEAGIVVKALRDESGFDLPRSRKLRAAWKALGHAGHAHAAHLGSPHVFVRAGAHTSMMPQLDTLNLRAERIAVFLRGAGAEPS